MFDFDFTQYQLFAQIIGFAGTLAVVFGMQQKQYHRIVLSKIANELVCVVHYFLLGGYTGMLINLASCFTNGVYWYRIKKEKSTLPFQILFGSMFVVLGALSWHGAISIFVVIAKLLSSVSLGINNPRTIRIINLISNPCWLIYNIYMGSIAGIISDLLVISSLIIAVIRLDICKKPSANKN